MDRERGSPNCRFSGGMTMGATTCSRPAGVEKIREFVRKRDYSRLSEAVQIASEFNEAPELHQAILGVAILGQRHQTEGLAALRSLMNRCNSLHLGNEAELARWCLTNFVFIGQRFAGIPDMPV